MIDVYMYMYYDSVLVTCNCMTLYNNCNMHVALVELF